VNWAISPKPSTASTNRIRHLVSKNPVVDTATPMAAVRTLQVQLSITTSAILRVGTTSSAVMPRCSKIQAVGLVVFRADHVVASADRVTVNAGSVEAAVPAALPERQATATPIDQTAYRLACLK